MTRPIKFRAWHTKQNRMFSCKEMVLDELALLPDGRFANISGVDIRLSVIYPVDVMIPLQYIGMKDCNGKDIYEGDIVRIGVGEIGEVKYGEYSCVADDPSCTGTAIGFNVNGNVLGNCYGWTETNSDNLEIIGNIYENGELLRDR